MNALNQIIIEGNLTRAPEVRNFPNGGKICILPIAVSRMTKAADGSKAEEVSYFEIEAYGNLADACMKWCPKGRGIRVVGRLKQGRWKSEDGKSHSKVTVVAEHIEFKYFNKKDENQNPSEDEPKDAYAGNPDKTKKEHIAMLAQVAQAAQKETEAEVAF